MLLSILYHAVSQSVRKLHISFVKVDSYLSFPVLRNLSLYQCHVSLTKWSFPSLTTLHLETVYPFGDELSFKEFHCLKNLSLGGCYGMFYLMDPEFVRIDPPNLETLTIFQGNAMPPLCKFLVASPKLKCFRFDGEYVPVVSAEGGFPCLEEVDFNINVGNGERMNVFMLKIRSLFREFCETNVLTLSLDTVQVLSRVQDFSKYQPSPFVNLKSLNLIDYVPPLPRDEYPAYSINDVVNYLLSNSPGAEIIIKKLERKIYRMYLPVWVS